MRVLVIGNGGREHAICWALKQSLQLTALYCAPGNPGIAALATLVPTPVDDIAGLVAFASREAIDLVVVGPEGPLVAGLADALRARHILCFGPNAAAAALEGSKGFMKDLVSAAGVPTARYRRCHTLPEALTYVRQQPLPIVIKADGLAAGKGVVIATTLAEAEATITAAMQDGVFGQAGAQLVIEEFLTGPEVSFFALTDGHTARFFAAAQDHKRAYDGDEGPNTGGMGAYSPPPILTAALTAEVMQDIITPTLQELQKRHLSFQGVLFAGLMLTPQGPKLLEYNVRFGDPETQAMLPRLQTDFLQICLAVAKGELADCPIEFLPQQALTVVMAADGYPGTYVKNTVIRGLEAAAASPHALVFHAGTSRNAGGDLLATGGRVLAITGLGATLQSAQTNAYTAVQQIDWAEGFYRRDIGWRELKK